MSHYFSNDKTVKHADIVIDVKIGNKIYSFHSDNGVFSKNKIDYGTLVLIKTILKHGVNGKVLDIGCGYGPIGIILKDNFECEVDMIDINERAINLAQKNLESNNVFCNVYKSDKYLEVKENYDYIVTNPPIRIGKEGLLAILVGAKEYLNVNGELWFVIRRNHGALSIKKELEKYYNVEIIDKEKGFYIIKAVLCWLRNLFLIKL